MPLISHTIRVSMKNGRACLVIDLSVSFGICFYRNEVNEKNPDGGPRRSSLQRSATLPANPRNNPILRHHQRYHQDESDQQIILQRPGHYPQLHQKIRIRVRSTSTDKGGEINNNNQNHVSITSIFNVAVGSCAMAIIRRLIYRVIWFLMKFIFNRCAHNFRISQRKWRQKIYCNPVTL